MGQRLVQDRIGAISESAGAITLAASVLTIGGQQYRTTGLSRTIATDLTMTATNRYQVYAILSSGIVALRVSANENSVGPAGFVSWKLVGSFYSNGVGAAVGLCRDVSSTPVFDRSAWTPTGSWVSNATYAGKWRQVGENAEINVQVSTGGAPTATLLLVNLPPNLVIDTAKLVGGTNYADFGVGQAHDSSVTTSYPVGVFYNTTTGVNLVIDQLTVHAGTTWPTFASVSQIVPFTWASGDFTNVTFSVPISGWSNVPIQDL